MKFFFNCCVFLCSCLISIQTVTAQEKFTISGYVSDSKNGEKLIGVTVFIQGTTIGALSNEYGFYSLTLPKGSYTLGVSYVGYQTFTKAIALEANQKHDVELQEESISLQEVVITSERKDANVKDVSMSINKLDIKTIQKIPAFLGEVDVIRSIQLLPGVSTVGEGATGFNVRGGSIDQNLVLIDEAPVYNSAHLFGFFSVFNPDIVKDVKLIKGGIPAQYGGRLSSILDVRTKEGNNKRFSGQGGIGAIFSRLALEAPIVKNKASFVIGARRSYIDVLAKPFLKDEELKNSKFYFYDLTAKVNYIMNDKNTFYLSGYFGRDVFGAEAFRFNWGSTTATARWNHVFDDKLFMNITGFYSNYDYFLGFRDTQQESTFDWNSNIINYSLKTDFIYYLNTKNTMRFGAQSLLYDFRPGNATITGETDTTRNLDKKYTLEHSLYIDNEQKIGDLLTLQYGLRYSLFQYLGPGDVYTYATKPNGFTRPPYAITKAGNWETIQSYGNFEPRFSANLSLNERSSLKASYNRTSQYIHLVSNTAASTPLDIWTPSTNNILPQLADQVALGYFRNFKDDMFEASLEVYYKKMQNQLDYVDAANLLLNPNLEGDLLQGIGRAYGLELFLRKAKGKLTGFVSYTLARTERRLEGTHINGGNWFANRFDRRHNLSITSDYTINTRWNVAANFIFQSGTPTTFYTNRAEFRDLPVTPLDPNQLRNNSRIPVYHRLDVSATLKNRKKEGRRWESYWVFSVYNLYNRRNPFSIYFQQNPDYRYRDADKGVPKTQAVRYSVVGSLIPAVSYNFKF